MLNILVGIKKCMLCILVGINAFWNFQINICSVLLPFHVFLNIRNTHFAIRKTKNIGHIIVDKKGKE